MRAVLVQLLLVLLNKNKSLKNKEGGLNVQRRGSRSTATFTKANSNLSILLYRCHVGSREEHIAASTVALDVLLILKA